VETPLPETTSPAPAAEVGGGVESGGSGVPTRPEIVEGAARSVREIVAQQEAVQSRLDEILESIRILEDAGGEGGREARLLELQAQAKNLATEAEALRELSVTLRNDSEKLRTLTLGAQP